MFDFYVMLRNIFMKLHTCGCASYNYILVGESLHMLLKNLQRYHFLGHTVLLV